MERILVRPSLTTYNTRFFSHQLLICIGTFVGYAIIFGIFYRGAGPGAGGLNVLPVFVGGWFYGRKGGIIAFVITVVTTPILFALFGAPPTFGQAVWYVIPNVVTLITVGVSVGWLRDVLDRLQIQSSELLQERERLQHLLLQREQIQTDLMQAKDRAEISNRAKSAFLATMSHELRTPLTTILGYAQILQLTAEHNNHQHYINDLSKIQEAGSHLQALISDVLDLSRIEAERMRLHTGPIVPHDLLQGIAGMMLPQVTQRSNSLELAQNISPARFVSDGTRVQQVLLNVVGNAAKFTENGEITISARELSAEQARLLAHHHGRVIETGTYTQWVAFEVRDSGIGLSPDQIERIFEPFTQVDELPTRQYGGAGLGLAISRKLCTLLGGDLMVQSQQGYGSKFTALFPNMKPS